MSIQFDPNIFAALGITPDANSMDNPKPPVDGTYTVNLKLAPIPATKKKEGKDVPNSKIVAGKEYVGAVIVPQGDAASVKSDDQGRANFTLFLEAEVLNDAGKRIRTLPLYVTSNTNRNGASMLFDLAKVILETHPSSQFDLVAAVQKYNDPSESPNPVWYGVAEAVAELLEGNPTGLPVPAFVTTNLEKTTGKKDAKGYDESEVLAYGSEKIQKKFPEFWTGDKLEDGYRLNTVVKGFKA